MPRFVDKKAKAKEISIAAIKVFRALGFHETRMADIAEAAGVGKGTLYEYFKGKAELVQFVFEDYFTSFSQGLARAMQTTATPSEKLLAFIDFAIVHAEEWEDQCTIYIDCFSSPVSRSELFSLAAIYDPMKQAIARLVREGQAAGEIDSGFVPEVVAQLFVSIYDGIILHRMLQGRVMERSRLHEAVALLLKKGLLSTDKDK